MWLFTKYGFYSAVCARQGNGGDCEPIDVDTIMVRARRKEHLTALQARFADLLGEQEIREYVGTDYAYRWFVPKDTWTTVVTELTRELDYSNFKSEMARHLGRAGAEYEDALHDVWSVMYRLQR